MNIHYTLHALERMHQRGIERGLVEECLGNPDKKEGLSSNIYRCIKRIDGKVIVVVYKREYNTIVVITAYVSSKIRKYLEW